MSEPTTVTPPAQTPPDPNVQPPAAPAAPSVPPAQTPPAEPPKSEPASPAKIVPEKYDLKIPDGALITAADVERIAAFAKERGLSNEEAQAVLERDNANIISYQENQKAQLEKLKTDWVEQVKSDKEIGGAVFNESIELSKRVIERFGSQELKQQLDATGFGNHPELVRIFSKIGKAMSEDKLVIVNRQDQPKKTLAEKMYGDNKQ